MISSFLFRSLEEDRGFALLPRPPLLWAKSAADLSFPSGEISLTVFKSSRSGWQRGPAATHRKIWVSQRRTESFCSIFIPCTLKN